MRIYPPLTMELVSVWVPDDPECLCGERSQSRCHGEEVMQFRCYGSARKGISWMGLRIGKRLYPIILKVQSSQYLLLIDNHASRSRSEVQVATIRLRSVRSTDASTQWPTCRLTNGARTMRFDFQWRARASHCTQTFHSARHRPTSCATVKPPEHSSIALGVWSVSCSHLRVLRLIYVKQRRWRWSS